MAKALVTGGAGFLGAHTARQLLDRGQEVVVLDDLSGGFEDQVPREAVFIKGSILDDDLLKKIFREHKFDSVFHLAAYAAEGLSHFIRRFNYANNLMGSLNLIHHSIQNKIDRFVFTSSIAVYGAGQVPLRESSTPLPEDPYGVAKLAVEQDLKSAHEMFGLDYTIFRPHNVYGELQNIGDRYRNVIGIFMNQLMQGEPLTVFGDGTQTRAFSYVSDVVTPMVQCLDLPETKNETFNVGADQPYSVNELAETVMSAMGKQSDLRHLEARNEVLHAYSDHSKIKKFFPNLQKPIDLKTGIEKMASWAMEVGPRKTSLFMDVEILEKMPPFWKKEFENVELKNR